MSDDHGLDLTGIGKLAKAIPQKAWLELVNTACDTFRKCVAPITATTGGIGRLIEAKFDRLVDAEKVLAADTVARAVEKASKSGKRFTEQIQAPIVILAIEQGATQSDDTLRELWANLLAQEFVTGSTHPDFPVILTRISPEEARVLAQVANANKDKIKHANAFIRSLSVPTLSIKFMDILPGEARTFAHEHLKLLGLIERRGGYWFLTLLGEAFIAAISDPAFD